MVCPMMVNTVTPSSSLTILRNFSSAMLIRLRRLIRSLSLTASQQHSSNQTGKKLGDTFI